VATVVVTKLFFKAFSWLPRCPRGRSDDRFVTLVGCEVSHQRGGTMFAAA